MKSHLNEKQIRFLGILLSVLGVLVVFSVEQFLQPGYWIKSTVKLVIFLGTILLYSVFSGKPFSETVRLQRIQRVRPLLLCMLLFFAGTALLFVILKGQLDLQSIKQSLMQKENLTKENCIFVFLYIIFCNSFLEESFFRGFVFQLFRDKKAGAVFSAVLFSLYHVGIFVTWFNPFVFLFCIVGLTAVGLFLQWISEKFNSILAGYITHACANTVINIIGALLLWRILK